MGGGNIAPQSVEEAAASLRSSRVSKLDGTKLNLGDARLEHTTTVEELKLWKNGIGPEGIKSMAGVISALPKLRMLNVYRNRLRDAGADFLVKSLAAGRCQLQSLWLGDNKIETFPEAILQITSLQKLHINDNRLETVPAELAAMPNLTLVDLDSNPLRGIPDDVYMRGLTRLPGPRWELLRQFLSASAQLEGGGTEVEDHASSAQRTRSVRNEAAGVEE